jgi:catechol 2,3-dioxygenase
MQAFPVAALRSVDIEVPDLASAERFYTDVWGLTVAHRAPDAVYFHGTGDDHHILALHPGSGVAMRSITFRAAERAALDHVAAEAVRQGGRLLQPVGPVDWVGGGVGTVIVDTQGRTLRVVHGVARRAPDVPMQDRAVRLAHVNVNSTDTEAATAFFSAVLGFRLTDRSKLMAFVRCNSDHHCIVIADAPVNTLNHVAFLMPTLEGVMLASGRTVDHGYPIGWGVGRHGPGDNVFAYFVDPFGVVVEYTAEVLQVDDGYAVRGPADWTWPPGRTDQWGIAPPKSEAVKRAQLAVPFAAPGAAQ